MISLVAHRLYPVPSTLHCLVLSCAASNRNQFRPLLFSLCTQPLEKIILRHKLSFNLFADYTQFYLTFDAFEAPATVAILNHCLSDNRDWIGAKISEKLNDDKTDFVLIFHPKSLDKIHNLDMSSDIQNVEPSLVLGTSHELRQPFVVRNVYLKVCYHGHFTRSLSGWHWRSLP